MGLDGPDLAAQRPSDIGQSPIAGKLAIEGGRIVTPTGTIEGGTIVVSGDRIERVRRGSAPLVDHVIDADGRVVIPGLVDIHGDDFEHQLVPRSGARVDPATAFLAADRLNVAHGVTTKLHAVAFEETGTGHRSHERARELLSVLGNTDGLLGTHLVHARFERHSLEPERVRAVVGQDSVAMTSLMHHAPGEGEYGDPAAFMERYVGDADVDRAHAEAIANARSDVVEPWGDPAPELVSAARANGIPVASHDDGGVAAVEAAADSGVDICEFPLTLEAIERANELGVTTAMGAPNLVRGGSLFDNLSTARAIDRDLVDILCADYHPPSILRAIFVETDEALHRRVRRVSAAPADALGIGDRGRIAPGARADIVAVEPEPIPRATDVIVGGRPVLMDACPDD